MIDSETPDKADAVSIDLFLRDAYLRSWGALWHRMDPSPAERVNALPGAATDA